MPEVTKVDVQLNPQRANATMNKSIDIIELQAQLAKAGHNLIKEIA